MGKDVHTAVKNFYSSKVILSRMLGLLGCGYKSLDAIWHPGRRQLEMKMQIACLNLPIIGEISTSSYNHRGVPVHDKWKKITGKEHIICYVNLDENNSIVTTGREGPSGSFFILS